MNCVRTLIQEDVDVRAIEYGLIAAIIATAIIAGATASGTTLNDYFHIIFNGIVSSATA